MLMALLAGMVQASEPTPPADVRIDPTGPPSDQVVWDVTTVAEIMVSRTLFTAPTAPGEAPGLWTPADTLVLTSTTNGFEQGRLDLPLLPASRFGQLGLFAERIDVLATVGPRATPFEAHQWRFYEVTPEGATALTRQAWTELTDPVPAGEDSFGTSLIEPTTSPALIDEPVLHISTMIADDVGEDD